MRNDYLIYVSSIWDDEKVLEMDQIMIAQQCDNT